MATGGIPQVSIKGSDEYNPFVCSPCSRKDREIGAEVYCTECEEYLCRRCLEDHNKFAKMAAHAMLDRSQMEAKGPQRVQPVLKVPCDRHPDQLYTMFCKKHDQVCCVVCSKVNHMFCDVKYLLDFTKGTKQGPELDKFKRSAKDVQKNLEMIRNKRKMDIQRLVSERDRELDKIQKTVKQMMKDLDAVEKNAIDDVCQKFSEFKANIDSDLMQLHMMIQAINTKLNKLEKASDEAEAFVHLKLCKENDVSAKKLIEEIQARKEDKIECKIGERAEESVGKLRSLGKFVLDCLYSTTPSGQFGVQTKEDGNVCDIRDICLVSGDTFLIADWANRCLKNIDKALKVVGCLNFDTEPGCVCTISAAQAAVTLSSAKTVHIVTIGRTMTISNSFKTRHYCRGIGYHDNQLYVSGGSGPLGGQYYIAVYTISGTVVRKLDADDQGMLFSSVPRGVAVNNDGTILVCDLNTGLVAVSQDGKKLWTVACKDIKVKSVNRVCVDSDGRVLVSSLHSNKIVLITKDGKKLGDVLTEKNGLNKPISLCVDRKHARLLVGMAENNQISAFDLAKIKHLG